MWRWYRALNTDRQAVTDPVANVATLPSDDRSAQLQAEREGVLDELHLAASRALISDHLFWRYRKNAHERAKLTLAAAVSAREQAISHERMLCERLFAELDQPEPTPRLRVIDGIGASFSPRRSAANG